MSKLEKQFVRAYEDYADEIFRFCFYRVFDRDTAKDITQETFTKTWKSLVDSTKIDNVRAFLYRTALNLIIDRSRRKKEESLEKLSVNGFEPQDSTRSPQLDAEIAEALDKINKLSVDQREVLLLRYVQDLGPKEIAELLGENQNVISVRINRAMKQLKKILNP